MSDKPKEPTKEEFYSKLSDDCFKALCANALTAAVAEFLANLEVRVTKLERNDL